MTGPKGNSEFCFPETLDVPRGGDSCYTPQLKIKQTTHECNTLQSNEEPKIRNTQLQKSTVLQEVKNVNNLKEMNESFFVTIKIYHGNKLHFLNTS